MKELRADCIAMPFSSVGPGMLYSSLHSLSGPVQVELYNVYIYRSLLAEMASYEGRETAL